VDAECATKPENTGFDVVALSVPSGTGWHVEVMTTSEPDSAAQPSITAGDNVTSGDYAAARRQSRWSKLDRTNRITALVLGGLVSVLVAGLIFGAGVLVGAEFGGGEGHGHHHERETSGYGPDGRDSGEYEGGGSEGNGDRGDGGSQGSRDQGEPAQQPSPTPPLRPTAPQLAPTATPRP
jgi:hypothetical protein